MKSNNNFKAKVVEAAGGVIWRKTSSGTKVAIIHRKRYNDWTLPKGKRESGESWQETALREAKEETGCPVKLGAFIGSTSYMVGNGPKVVLFWLMSTKNKHDCKLKPNNEVDRVKWVTPNSALKLLDYKDERAILRMAVKVLQNGK
jgi:8-oxo-dGTP pyrophosphatase MutT (NUDIX family)